MKTQKIKSRIKKALKTFYKGLQHWGEAAAFATQHRNGTQNQF